MSKGGRYLKKEAPVKKKKSASTVILVILIVVLLIAILAVGVGIWFYNDKLNRITRPETEYKNPSQEEIDSIMNYAPEADAQNTAATEAPTEETTEPTVETTEDPTYYEEGKLGKIVNIMVVGQSGREGEVGKMSDTMILCTVNKETKKLTLTSFPRDSYVKLPNYVDSSGRKHSCGMQRINVNYALGYSWGGTLDAMGMLNQCIYENYGAEVDFNVEVNFYTFRQIINKVGGVEIELTEAEAKHMTEELDAAGTFEPGLNTLDGRSALHYARIRKIDSDMERGNRQRKLITAIINKVRSMSLTELNDLANLILPSIVTNMTNDDITNCLLELLPLLPKLEIVSNQCPAEGTYTGQMVDIYGVMSGVIVPNLNKNRELLTAITEEAVEPVE